MGWCSVILSIFVVCAAVVWIGPELSDLLSRIKRLEGELATLRQDFRTISNAHASAINRLRAVGRPRTPSSIASYADPDLPTCLDDVRLRDSEDAR